MADDAQIPAFPSDPFPDAVVRRNPWASIAEAVPALRAKHEWMKAPAKPDGNARAAWMACHVTIGALALLSDEIHGVIETEFSDDSVFMDEWGPFTVADADPDMVPLWAGISTIRIVAWTGGELVGDIRFDAAAGGEGLRYAGSALTIGEGDIPLTIRTLASDEDMTRLLPHPLFVGRRWRTDQGDANLVLGPKEGYLLGAHPGRRLASLARAERGALLEAAASMGMAPADDAPGEGA